MTEHGTTQLLSATRGHVTPQMRRVAEKEQVPIDRLTAEVASGRVVIPANPRHAALQPQGIGMPLSTKINANIGNSSVSGGKEEQIEKLNVAEEHGADAVMDLSTGPQVAEIRSAILENSSLPVGTVPIYEAAARSADFKDISGELLLQVVEEHARHGIDFITLHSGLLREHMEAAHRRLMGIVSRGGSLLAAWMKENDKQNPLYSHFSEILDICRTYDVTISLGDGLRPGCIADASDEAQFAELEVLGSLVEKSQQAGVQVMVEGPGHIPIDQIQDNIEREMKLCKQAPFYILGPIVTDSAPGYDHLTGAIGGALGAAYGAAMLCYVTPREHLGLPDAEDVREGVSAFRIAAHAADIAKGHSGAIERDRAMAQARTNFDWERQFQLALDPKKARSFRNAALAEQESLPPERSAEQSSCDSSLQHIRSHHQDARQEYCTMCGPEFCSLRQQRDSDTEHPDH